MIKRVDLPVNSALFKADYEGNQPYNSKYSIPVNRIYYADTPFTVRSLGLSAYWFNNSNNWTGTTMSGTIPGGIVKFWWDYGYPPEISLQSNNKWGLLCTGYFKPEYNGNYKFYFGGQGEIQTLKVNGVSLTLSPNSALSVNDSVYRESINVSLSSSTWVPFSFKYRSSSSIDKYAGLVALYKRTNDDVLMPDKVVLSAGVTSQNKTAPVGANMPILIHTVTGYISTKVKYDDFGAQNFEFVVPFVDSSSSYLVGGYAKYGTDSFWNVTDTARSVLLKKFRTIQYYEGYLNTSGAYEMVQKFSGNIKDFKINYSVDGSDELTVVCESPINFTRTQFAEYVPNPSDYIAAGYLSEITSHVNGRTKPRCYDGWEVYKVFQNLLLNSYIDPTLFYKKKEFNNNANKYVTGDYLIAYTNTSNGRLWLNRQLNYGNVSNVDSKPDDEYLYIADTGEFYYDLINKFVEPYLFRWGFDRRGYPFLFGIDTPSRIVDDQSFTQVSGSWTTQTGDFNTIKAVTSRTATLGAQATTTGFFSRADIIVKAGPNNGVLDSSKKMFSVQINDADTLSLIYSTTITSYFSTSWSYYQGPHPTTGINPCIYNIASGLNYSRYKITITRTTSFGYLDLDGVLMYDVDINSPSFNFYTGDSISNGQITQLDVDETAGDIRNTCVVLGKRTGTKSGYKDDFIDTDVNPNNPIGTFYSSKVVDLYSISSPSAINYAGVPLKTIIVEPNITSQDQADFIAFEYVNTNRNSHQEVNFVTVGNPMIEINDCVSVNDDYKKGIKSTTKLWITSVENEFKNNGYFTSFSAIDIKPVSSFIQKPQPNLALYGNNPLQNVRIYNGGNICNLSATLTSGVTTEISVNSGLSYAPQRGYVKVYHGSDEEIIKYNSIQKISTNSGKYIGLTRGLQGTTTKTFTIGTVIGAWDQYTQDGMGIVPVIMFDLIADGQIEVVIKGITDNVKYDIARLTNQFSNNYPYDGYNELTWGANKYFTWNGNDDFGIWNTEFGLELPQGSKSGIFTTESIKNGVKQKYSEFIPYILYRGENGSTSYPSTLSSAPRIYTRRGTVSSVTFDIVDRGIYQVNENSSGIWTEAAHTESGSATYFTYAKSSSNLGKMIMFRFKDVTSDNTKDKDYKRLHRIYMKSKLEKFYGFYFKFKRNVVPYGITEFDDFRLSIGPDEDRIIFDGKDYIEDLYQNNTGVEGYFNPEKNESNAIFTFMPPQDFISSAKETYSSFKNNPSLQETSPASDFIFIMPFVAFHGFIVDKSGRKLDVDYLIEGYPGTSQSNLMASLMERGGRRRTSSISYPPVIGWSNTNAVGTKVPIAISPTRHNLASKFYEEICKKYAGGIASKSGVPLYIFQIGTDNF